MHILNNIQELSEISGGQITVGTSGQYDLGYLIGSSIVALIRLFNTATIVYPYVL
ncbi:MAG: hypothetical protein K9H49_12940 [Bacteroidales bacterium]|nr:hypothetical protein [Bacteroidales bacterium]MCF8390405.1 hypothetical protein [Bacteroidales bacterium]